MKDARIMQGVDEKLGACLAEADRCPASLLIQQLQVPHLMLSLNLQTFWLLPFQVIPRFWDTGRMFVNTGYTSCLGCA